MRLGNRLRCKNPYCQHNTHSRLSQTTSWGFSFCLGMFLMLQFTWLLSHSQQVICILATVVKNKPSVMLPRLYTQKTTRKHSHLFPGALRSSVRTLSTFSHYFTKVHFTFYFICAYKPLNHNMLKIYKIFDMTHGKERIYSTYVSRSPFLSKTVFTPPLAYRSFTLTWLWIHG